MRDDCTREGERSATLSSRFRVWPEQRIWKERMLVKSILRRLILYFTREHIRRMQGNVVYHRVVNTDRNGRSTAPTQRAQAMSSMR